MAQDANSMNSEVCKAVKQHQAHAGMTGNGNGGGMKGMAGAMKGVGKGK